MFSVIFVLFQSRHKINSVGSPKDDRTLSHIVYVVLMHTYDTLTFFHMKKSCMFVLHKVQCLFFQYISIWGLFSIGAMRLNRANSPQQLLMTMQRRIQAPVKHLGWSFCVKIISIIQPSTIFAKKLHRRCLKRPKYMSAVPKQNDLAE